MPRTSAADTKLQGGALNDVSARVLIKVQTVPAAPPPRPNGLASMRLRAAIFASVSAVALVVVGLTVLWSEPGEIERAVAREVGISAL